MSTTTAADVIQEVRDTYLQVGHEGLNKLSGSLDSSATTLTLAYDLGGALPGAELSIDTERLHVWAAVSSTKVLTVQRGAFRSTAAAHSDASIVRVNPRYPDAVIFDALNAELRSLSGRGVGRVQTVDLSYDPSVLGYNLTSVAAITDVLRVTIREAGSDILLRSTTSYRLERNASTTDFASGFALTLFDSTTSGQPIRVHYLAPFTPYSTTADNTETVTFLRAAWHDILVLGAALRLLSGRDVHRSDTAATSDMRRADQVPPGAATDALRPLRQQYEMRLMQARGDLMGEYPLQAHRGWV